MLTSITVVGRIKDIIIRGGEVRISEILARTALVHQISQNLFPVQIENALTTHPGIHEAAAVAVPDTRYGEVVGAWVVRAPGHDDISMEEVRKAVSDAMNPQVSWKLLGGSFTYLSRTPRRGFGSRMSFQRQRVG